ncbi:hypothetical protein K439DRAFT_1246911, partial [Ramaria rubella]
FNPEVVQGDSPGWMRQEFRELELLDEITCMQQVGDIHPQVQGSKRNELLT